MDTISDNSRAKKPLNKKGLTTLVLFLSSLIVSFSGIVLYISPKKYAPAWAKGLLLGLEKDQWKEIHTVVSVLLIIVAIVHLYLNWRIFSNYIKSRIKTGLNLKRELAIACLIVAFFVGGTIMEAPPFYSIITVRKIFKSYFKKYENQHKKEIRRLKESQGSRKSKTVDSSVVDDD